MDACKEKHNCATCPSRQSTEWRDLSENELVFINRVKRTCSFEPGAVLYDQGGAGDGIYCIQSGMIGLRRLDSDGNSVLLRLCASGTTVGYRAFLSKEIHRNSAEVLTPSVACFIERSHVSKLLAANPSMGERFLQHAISDLNETEEDYARRLTMNLRSRFLHLIMVFYEQLGYHDDMGHPTLDLPIKKSELADMIGAQPESISRVIRNVQTLGLLKIDERCVRFQDMEAVLREARAEF